jgi:pyruvate dehydrogenase E1 component beta subunit
VCAGTDITLISHSRMVGLCLQAADVLLKSGISAEVMNLRTIRPLDRAAILDAARRNHRIVTVEEGWPQSGVGAEISAMIVESDAFHSLDAPIERVTGADIPMPYAENLEALARPKVEDIVAVAERVCFRE